MKGEWFEGSMERGGCRILILVGLALASCACDGISTSTPTPPIPADAEPTIVESWTGTVPTGGASFYSFGVSQRGTVRVTLQSVGGDPAPTLTLGLAVGTPSGSVCLASGVVNAQAGSAPQLTGTYNIGVYCTNVTDVGGLPGPTSFSVSIAHP